MSTQTHTQWKYEKMTTKMSPRTVNSPKIDPMGIDVEKIKNQMAELYEAKKRRNKKQVQQA